MIIKLKRGLNTNVSGLSLQAGEPAFVTDSGKLYIGNGVDKVLINPDNAPINSPTFTGIPNAPTASTGTNSTQIATTAFVANTITSSIATIDGGTF